ncbi:hypothetical protein ACOMHN_042472 [Nucella lapillus]
MTTAVMATQLDIGETVFGRRRNSSSSSACRVYQANGYGLERRPPQQWQMACSSTTTTTTTLFAVPRHRNLSGPCSTGPARSPTLDKRALATPPPGVPGSRCGAERESRDKDHSKDGGRNGLHRKLDRSLSDSEDRINGNGRSVNSSRYKTELCRPYEESGHCKYGEKCQFAHGFHELRNMSRHPKYKTERCRTYHTAGFCPYGPRCHFIHEEAIAQRKTSRSSASSSSGKPSPVILPSSFFAHRPSNLNGLNSLGSSFESVSSSSTPGNLSPSHVDDQFPPIGTFCPSDVADALIEAGHEFEPSSSSSSNTVFNFPASDAESIGSIMTPLNIQTQQMYNNVLDMAALARFSAVLNISQNQHNNGQSSSSYSSNVCNSRQQQQQEAEVWSLDLGMPVPPPPTPPSRLMTAWAATAVWN